MARVLAREIGAVAIRLAAYLGTLALIAAAALQLLPATEGFSRATEPPRQQWIEVERPHQAFAIAVPATAGAQQSYRVMRDPAADARRDIIGLHGGGRDAIIEIKRSGRARAVADDPASDVIVRAAAAMGTVADVALAPPVETRFGEVTLVDFTIVKGERRRGCVGFVRPIAVPPLQIAGWVCQAGPGMVARPAVVCALDKLTLLSAGGDRGLAQVFAQAELGPALCPPSQARPATGGLSAWIDRRRTAARLRGAIR